MTLQFRPGGTLAHRLDPRSKLCFQVGFAVAALAAVTPPRLALLSGLVAVVLSAGRVSPFTVLVEYRFVLPFLVAGPILQAFILGHPWFVAADGLQPALASYRVLLVLAVSAVYVRTTRVRQSRAAIVALVPGRPGQFLGTGAAFVLRFLPLLQSDLAAIRSAMAARLGSERPLSDRIQLVAIGGLARAFQRSERLSLALRARCYSWNPTPPRLVFSRLDVPVLVVAAGLVVSAVV